MLQTSDDHPPPFLLPQMQNVDWVTFSGCPEDFLLVANALRRVCISVEEQYRSNTKLVYGQKCWLSLRVVVCCWMGWEFYVYEKMVLESL